MKKTKLLLLAASFVLGAGTMVSCGGGNGGGGAAAGKLKLWFPQEDIDARFTSWAVEEFKKDYPKYKNYTFTVEPVGEDAAKGEVQHDASSAADVFHFADDQLEYLATGSYLAMVPPSYSQALDIDADTMKAGQIGTSQYAVPFTQNCFYLFYDASVYSDVSTIDAILGADVKNHRYTYNLSLPIKTAWYTQSLFYSNGCTVYGADGTDPQSSLAPLNKAEEVADWLYNAFKNSKYQIGENSDKCGVENAAAIAGIWKANPIKAQIERHGGIFACAPLPKVSFDGGNTYKTWLSPNSHKLIGVNNLSKEKFASFDFVSFLSSEKVQDKRFELRETCPVNNKSKVKEGLESSLPVQAQLAQMENVFNLPKIYDKYGFFAKMDALSVDLQNCKNSLDVVGYLEDQIEQFKLEV